MHPKRLTTLQSGQKQSNQSYILYWMQQAQRIHYNHALNHAVRLANQWQKKVVVVFALQERYLEANRRHYTFMLEGLKEIQSELEALKITFVLRFGSPAQVLNPLMNDAMTLVMDAGYLMHQRQWRKDVLQMVHQSHPQVQVDLVETDLIVPVQMASPKAEYGAYTLRPKIMRIYREYCDGEDLPILNHPGMLPITSDDEFSSIDQLCHRLNVLDCPISFYYHGGYSEAIKRLDEFITHHVTYYLDRSDPKQDVTSKMSMYLHFGQISALEILQKIDDAFNQQRITIDVYDALIEQLLVRRELAFNYVFYHHGYDCYDTMTEPWAYQTMEKHANDERPILYTYEEMEASQTHDPYFNAAMDEMRMTGYMHNYMRMYWAKKIIEWSPTHRLAYQTIIKLNNTYFIDGRDANSYASIAWCFGKHDRAWTERPIFGTLRYMNDKGLERKFDMTSYLNRISLIKKADHERKNKL